MKTISKKYVLISVSFANEQLPFSLTIARQRNHNISLKLKNNERKKLYLVDDAVAHLEVFVQSIDAHRHLTISIGNLNITLLLQEGHFHLFVVATKIE